MIKAIVLDVDGVIVGTKHGENFPMPSKKVSKILRKIHDKGIPVSFCSAKSSFAIAETIKHVGLDNIHIADAGAVLYNPIQKKVMFERPIPKQELTSVVELLFQKNTYTMLFSPDSYYLLEKHQSPFTHTYTSHVGRTPEVVTDFKTVIGKKDIVKIISFVFDLDTRNDLDTTMKLHRTHVSFSWAGAPIFDPAKALVVTAKGISKRSGVKELAHFQHVSLENILAVGDSIQDWEFIEVCGYKGTLVNAAEELKEKFDFSDPHQFMGSHVNEDGLIDVLKHFKLY